jgi:hypothetical protein
MSTSSKNNSNADTSASKKRSVQELDENTCRDSWFLETQDPLEGFEAFCQEQSTLSPSPQIPALTKRQRTVSRKKAASQAASDVKEVIDLTKEDEPTLPRLPMQSEKVVLIREPSSIETQVALSDITEESLQQCPCCRSQDTQRQPSFGAMDQPEAENRAMLENLELCMRQEEERMALAQQQLTTSRRAIENYTQWRLQAEKDREGTVTVALHPFECFLLEDNERKWEKSVQKKYQRHTKERSKVQQRMREIFAIGNLPPTTGGVGTISNPL